MNGSRFSGMPMRRAALFFVSMLTACATPAFSAGFDCGKATTLVERQICGTPDLGALDSRLDTEYKKVITDTDNAAAWQKDQRKWLAERNTCTTASCLRNRYVNRITLLRMTQQPTHWAGKWWRIDNSGSAPAELTISRVSRTSIGFGIQASTGANSGDIAGTAKLRDDASADFHGKAPDYAQCSLSFVHTLNRIEVTQQGNDAECGAGQNVSYGGTYVQATQDPNPKADLVLREVFKTHDQDKAFRTLVGADYGNFVDMAQGVGSEQGTLDGHSVTVVQMFVQGVACTNKAIVMYDGLGHFWAAVWVFGNTEKDPMQIHYYTNVKADAATLPDVIAESGRQTCSSVVTKYMNR